MNYFYLPCENSEFLDSSVTNNLASMYLGNYRLMCISMVDGIVQDCNVSYTLVSETSAGCLRSIYPSLGMRQLFGDVTWASDVTINRPN